MAEMKALLSFMDAEDRLKVMRRYERRFDEVGREGETALIRELGSPVRQVLMVEKEYREREEAGLPGVADEVYEEEPTAVEEVTDAEPTVEEQAAEVMEALLAEEGREELIEETPETVEVCEEEEVPEEEEAAGEEEYEEKAEEAEAPGTGRVIGAVALTPILIALALFGVALTAVLTAVVSNNRALLPISFLNGLYDALPPVCPGI